MKAIVPAWRANSISHNWFNEFDQLFENMFDTSTHNRMSLACDVEESEKYILFSFDLPGLEEKDINIELKDSILSVSGERTEEVHTEGARAYRGRNYGSFVQRFKMPENVDQEKIEADYSNGVLKILLPKVEAAQPKKVEVKTKKGNFLTELLKGGSES